ncbi:hypothetical protein HK101_011023, partial [Irineochytrium annulatum]
MDLIAGMADVGTPAANRVDDMMILHVPDFSGLVDLAADLDMDIGGNSGSGDGNGGNEPDTHASAAMGADHFSRQLQSLHTLSSSNSHSIHAPVPFHSHQHGNSGLMMAASAPAATSLFFQHHADLFAGLEALEAAAIAPQQNQQHPNLPSPTPSTPNGMDDGYNPVNNAAISTGMRVEEEKALIASFLHSQEREQRQQQQQQRRLQTHFQPQNLDQDHGSASTLRGGSGGASPISIPSTINIENGSGGSM